MTGDDGEEFRSMVQVVVNVTSWSENSHTNCRNTHPGDCAAAWGGVTAILSVVMGLLVYIRQK